MASWVWIWILVVAVWFARHGALGTYVCGKGVTTKTYSQCKLLPSLDASLAWTLDKSTNSIDFAFTGTVPASPSLDACALQSNVLNFYPIVVKSVRGENCAKTQGKLAGCLCTVPASCPIFIL